MGAIEKPVGGGVYTAITGNGAFAVDGDSAADPILKERGKVPEETDVREQFSKDSVGGFFGFNRAQ
jgi:hypothetical protein